MNIKDWTLEDRPREKLYQKGAKQLSDAELLAIIISSGTRSVSALELAKGILSHADNNLDTLARKDITTLCKIKGVGPAKATAIKAVMELANRKNTSKSRAVAKITCSQDSFAALENVYKDLDVEEFWILYLNRANKVIGKFRVGVGGVTGVIVDSKIIYQKAINLMATGMILSHNHPSGNLKPSKNDIQVTNKLKEGGKHFDIVVYDHIIVAGKSYFSFADEGLI
jgi:DNA repair protein RadC